MAKNNSKVKSVIITGKVYWACITNPNTTFEPAWLLDLCLTPETKQVVEAVNLPIKNKDDDRGDFVTLKRKVLRKDGTKNEAPKVFDAQKNAWDDRLIGNGSVCNVKFVPFEWVVKGKAGVSGFLDSVQVVDLVSFSSDGFEVTEGFSLEDTSSHDEANISL